LAGKLRLAEGAAITAQSSRAAVVSVTGQGSGCSQLANTIVANTHIAAHKTNINEHFVLNLYSHDSMLATSNLPAQPAGQA
jgi:hypothetical protein